MLRLAGTLAYLDWAFMQGPEPREIAERFVVDASYLVVNYFWPHARACLRQIDMSQYHADARRVLRWLKVNGNTQVSREEVRRQALGQRRDADGTQELLAYLVRAGWLRPWPATVGAKGGRPAHRWEVNPQLRQE